MYFTSFLILSSFLINFGSASEISSDIIHIDSNKVSTSQLLNAYYNEFKQTAVADKNCKSEQETPQKKNSLANYYAEFLK